MRDLIFKSQHSRGPFVCVALILSLLTLLLLKPASVSAQQAKIYGRVGIKDSEAPPPSETVVVVIDTRTRKKIKSQKINGARGDYEISGLDPGTYDLVAHDGGSYIKDPKPAYRILKGSNRIDFAMKHVATLGRVSGLATSADNAFLANATVSLVLPECPDCEIIRTTTDNFGAYTFVVAPDMYRVGVQSKNTSGIEVAAFVTDPVRVALDKPLAFDLKLTWHGSELNVIGVQPNFQPLRPREEVVVRTYVERSLSGTVTDNTGAAVPGIAVTAIAEGGRSLTTTTDSDGIYRFLNLEPGNYTVSADAQRGFAKFVQPKVRVGLSIAAVADMQLRPEGAQSTVTITDTAGAAVDVSGTTTGSTISSEFSNFPTQRTVQGLYTIAPTLTHSGLRDAAGRDRDPSMAGSSGPENNYILNGVNTTDAAFGGSGANLPFEFVQEVEVKTNGFDAEYGGSNGGVLNVFFKSGGNEFHGDIFGYGTTKSLSRDVKNFPFINPAFDGFSNADVGGDLGGPIVIDKLWFFGAFNPQRRKNYYLTQTFHQPAFNKGTIPVYTGKISWAINPRNTVTVSTFGDLTKIDGFLATSPLNNVNGFGDDITAFEGRRETGGHNYLFTLNSTITHNFIAEILGGLYFQRANTIPRTTDKSRITDNFAVLKNGTVLVPAQTGVYFGANTGFLDYVDGRGGSLQRNFVRGSGFGFYSAQTRDHYKLSARMQNIIANKHVVKWGVSWSHNRYNFNTRPTGPAVTYAFTPGALNADGTPLRSTNSADANSTSGSLITNNWLVCAVRGATINCPSTAAVERALAIPSAQLAALGLTVNPAPNTLNSAEVSNNPFLIRGTTRVRNLQIVGPTNTNVESFYASDDWRLPNHFQLRLGLRWDYQQGYRPGKTYLKFNSFEDNLSPRLGFVWDFTGRGKGKLFANYAQFIETPIPPDINVRAGGGDIRNDKRFNVDRLNAPAGSLIVPGVSTGATNLGFNATVDPGLKPQSVREFSFGTEYEVGDIVLGGRGIYRAMVNVIEDGSFDDGDTYFIFNPGRLGPGTTENAACAGDPATGRAPQCLGRAQRFYRALELTATKRFTHHFQFIASYVFSSLIGNYEDLADNNEIQSTITSLFDSPSLLANTYGRLPDDQPHQFKFNATYNTPFGLTISGNFNAQSGIPFNALIPHSIYGNNEGFLVPRGTATVPTVFAFDPGFPNIVDSIGSKRTPSTMKLDLGFSQLLWQGESKEFRVSVDWFNVLNGQRAVALDHTFEINSGVAGIPNVSNPFFGSAVLAQAPSTLRFGAKFKF